MMLTPRIPKPPKTILLETESCLKSGSPRALWDQDQDQVQWASNKARAPPTTFRIGCNFQMKKKDDLGEWKEHLIMLSASCIFKTPGLLTCAHLTLIKEHGGSCALLHLHTYYAQNTHFLH